MSASALANANSARVLHAKATLVLDTNIVLDLWVFDDPATQTLRDELAQGRWRWLASLAMREELQRVLAYPHLVRRMQRHAQSVDQSKASSAEAVMAQFDAHVQRVAPAPKAVFTCIDPDDQKFIDLAVAHQATLLSKDAAVLCMKKRLERLGVSVQRALISGA